MTFYQDIRDNTASPLLKEFGESAVYRVFEDAVYDNATGKTTNGQATDLSITVVEINGQGPLAAQEWSDDVAERLQKVVIASATEFANKGVAPEVEKSIVYGGKEYKILAVKATQPGGVPLIYRMALYNA